MEKNSTQVVSAFQCVGIDACLSQTVVAGNLVMLMRMYILKLWC